MVFRAAPHIERAKALSESDDVHSLRYACLELRLALERIAYQKLQLRLSEISSEEIAAWQPKRVIDALMELVDPRLDQDATLSMGSPSGKVDPAHDTYTPIGTNRGIDPKKIGKYWQKLGSYLHARAPKMKGEHPPEPDIEKLRAFVHEVIAYIEDVTSTGFDMHFSEKTHFECQACHQEVFRNSRLLKDGEIVQCQNPECDASYLAHKEGDGFFFKPYLLSIDCKDCNQTIHIDANKLLSIPYTHGAIVKCDCGARHHVRWSLQSASEAGLPAQVAKEAQK